MTVQFIKKGNFETTNLDNEWIVLNTNKFTVTKLNEVGGYCWNLLSEVQTVESLICAIKEKYEPNEKMDYQEIEHFLSDLLDCGLIEHVV